MNCQVFYSFFVLLMLKRTVTLAAEPQLPCASCVGVQCGAQPTGCELDKIPCGCCFSCVRLEGELCEAFAPRCGTGLKCLTPGGMYDGRPPWYNPYFKGVCVTDPTLHLIPTTHGPVVG